MAPLLSCFLFWCLRRRRELWGLLRTVLPAIYPEVYDWEHTWSQCHLGWATFHLLCLYTLPCHKLSKVAFFKDVNLVVARELDPWKWTLYRVSITCSFFCTLMLMDRIVLAIWILASMPGDFLKHPVFVWHLRLGALWGQRGLSPRPLCTQYKQQAGRTSREAGVCINFGANDHNSMSLYANS